MPWVLEDELVAMLPRLRRMARGLARNDDEADELVQSTCERALAGKAGFTPGTRFDSWLYRIMQNQWVDGFRRRQRQGSELDLEAAGDAVGADGRRDMENHLRLARVRQVIRRLPEEQRLALVLVTINGLSYREAAEQMAVPLGTLMSRLGRARRKLIELVEGREDQGPAASSARPVTSSG